jgi:hypothetical protein
MLIKRNNSSEENCQAFSEITLENLKKILEKP